MSLEAKSFEKVDISKGTKGVEVMTQWQLTILRIWPTYLPGWIEPDFRSTGDSYSNTQVPEGRSLSGRGTTDSVPCHFKRNTHRCVSLSRRRVIACILKWHIGTPYPSFIRSKARQVTTIETHLGNIRLNAREIAVHKTLLATPSVTTPVSKVLGAKQNRNHRIGRMAVAGWRVGSVGESLHDFMIYWVQGNN